MAEVDIRKIEAKNKIGIACKFCRHATKIVNGLGRGCALFEIKANKSIAFDNCVSNDYKYFEKKDG